MGIVGQQIIGAYRLGGGGGGGGGKCRCITQHL